tara:strand:+ start:4693 stop:5085 length:393 start_codon:yes stop_codon:yes gene_type:complete
MNGISPKLPLMVDDIDGHYNNNKTIKESVAQNLKHLLLTNKGEKMMDPSFGAGLMSHLFEPMLVTSFPDIETSIIQQVAKYLPFVEITDIQFQTGNPDLGQPPELLSIRVDFIITPIQESAILVINSDLN